MANNMDHDIKQQIDNIIQLHSGWKGELLARLRKTILNSNSDIIEEVKWKMATRPEGLPVWSHKGIICFAEIWKDNVKLLFPKGANLKDKDKLFNARLKSATNRAIEFHEGDKINIAALQEMVKEAFTFNVDQKK